MAVTMTAIDEGPEAALNELIVVNAESPLEEGLECINLLWAYKMISLGSDFDSMLESIDIAPNRSNPFIKYCANHVNYEVFIELETGNKYRMKDIHEALKLL